jgi:hypothetical protein|tara:strand:+ start:716 stop:847 length:132 start_codon:yes stop_codon:yes gene_type:complete
MGPKIEEIEDDLPPLEDAGEEVSTADSGDDKVRLDVRRGDDDR